MDVDICPICTNTILSSDYFNSLTVKGIVSLHNASMQRNVAPFAVTVGQKVHTQCRSNYTHPRKIELHLRKEKEPSTPQGKRLRSKESFNFRENCLFCINPIDQGTGMISEVSTLAIQDSLLQACSERNDDWSHPVRGRIESVNDLRAADAVYHRTCYTNFVTNREVPLSQAGPSTQAGPCQKFINIMFLMLFI